MTYKEFIEGYANISEENFDLLVKFYDGKVPFYIEYFWEVASKSEIFGFMLVAKIKQYRSISLSDEVSLLNVTFPLCNFPEVCSNIRTECSEDYDFYLAWYLKLHSIMLKIWHNYE